MATKKKFKSVYDSPYVQRTKLYAIRVKLLREEDRSFYLEHGQDARWLVNWGAGVVHGPQDEAMIFTNLKDVEKVLAYLNWLNEKDEHFKAQYEYDHIEVDVLTFGDMAKYQERVAEKERKNREAQ